MWINVFGSGFITGSESSSTMKCRMFFGFSSLTTNCWASVIWQGQIPPQCPAPRLYAQRLIKNKIVPRKRKEKDRKATLIRKIFVYCLFQDYYYFLLEYASIIITQSTLMGFKTRWGTPLRTTYFLYVMLLLYPSAAVALGKQLWRG